MIITRPDYYDQFRCLAGRCPDSCCHEWEVEVDPQSAAGYLELSGDLADQLKQHLYQDQNRNWSLRIQDGRCPMWQEDGLCRIQKELGEDALCQVCHDFPRLRHDYGDFIELGLELSCPEAARLILSTPSPSILCQTISHSSEPEYDTEAMQILQRTRQTALELLQYGSVPEGLALLLLYGYRAQEELDGGASVPCIPEQELAFARTLAQKGSIHEVCSLFAQLEILTDRWAAFLEAPHNNAPWTEQIRAMACYGVHRYWLQSVSDYDLACRVKMIVTSCLLVHHLGGDSISTAQLWSKEIENNIDNVEALLDAAYQSPLITDAKLLGMLFEDHQRPSRP